uniref:Mitochondrial ribosome-associated GTPase 1 n=1 Tax=Takifugu rubripes TaxID=31033 RepID=H2UEF9_TAKRU
MAKGIKQMKASLKSVDCIIEIHDARIPLSGRNPVFQETLDVRPHLLVLNKMDLADVSDKKDLLEKLAKKGVKNVLFTDCLKQRDDSVIKVVPTVVELIESSPRFSRCENTNYCLMVIGVPNVGKSSFINSLRRTFLKKGRASRVGGEPGITKAVLTKIQVCGRPIMHLLDTPGVLPPKIESVETGMKLALCGTILDHLVGEDIIADYLLYSLNRLEKFSYVEKYDLEQPSDDIHFVLKRIAVKLRKTQRVKAITGFGNITVTVPNYTAAAYDFIRAFRKVLADANFPASSICACGPTEIRADGLGIPLLLEAILRLMPLDTYVTSPAAVMELVDSDKIRGLAVPVWDEYKQLLSQAGSQSSLELVERFAFYERAKKAFAVVATGESALYGNLILKKGVIPAGQQ